MAYDLCVIGSGPAGQKAAIQAAKLDKRAVLVEKRDVVGGVAINTGTIPSKALREAILRLGGRATAMPRVEDFRTARAATFVELQRSVQGVIQAEIRVVNDQLRRNGVEVVHGAGRFAGPNQVEVHGPGGVHVVEAERFVIAVGARPARPDDIPFDGSNIVTSDELIHLDYLPNTMLVVGGGVIGSEYASMLQALGVRVTLVEGRGQLLGFMDDEITEAFQYHLRQADMTLRLNEKVVKIEAIDPPRGARAINERMGEVTLESGKTLRADCVLYCVGRQGSTDDLNLEAVGIEADERGRISVNERFQTSAEHIYACGDVIGFPALASTSMEQGRVAACHMFDEPCTHDRDLLPFGVYAVPEMSMVGWTEERLTREGIPFESGKAHYREIARGQLLGDEIGMLKLLVHQDSRTVLGVHALGAGATELIHIGQAAIAFKATVEYFIDTVFNYPTLAECYKVAAFNVLNRIRGV